MEQIYHDLSFCLITRIESTWILRYLLSSPSARSGVLAKVSIDIILAQIGASVKPKWRAWHPAFSMGRHLTDVNAAHPRKEPGYRPQRAPN